MTITNKYSICRAIAQAGCRMKKKRLVICLLVTTGVIIILSLLFLILGLTVFKPKDPVINVDSIALKDIDFYIDLPKLQAYLNVSLETNLTATNPNRVGFKYDNSTAFLQYRGNQVGEVPIIAGKIGARSSGMMSVTITIMADRLINVPNFFSDVMSGTINFQANVRLRGKVRLLFSIHVVAYARCDLEIHPFSKTLVNQICHYKTKL